jgi:hypothetical protein
MQAALDPLPPPVPPDAWPSHQLAMQPASDALPALRAFLTSQSDGPVRLSAMGLRRIDGLMLQELLAAARHWSRRGLGFDVADRSPAMAEMLTLLGVQDDMLQGKV